MDYYSCLVLVTPPRTTAAKTELPPPPPSPFKVKGDDFAVHVNASDNISPWRSYHPPPPPPPIGNSSKSDTNTTQKNQTLKFLIYDFKGGPSQIYQMSISTLNCKQGHDPWPWIVKPDLGWQGTLLDTATAKYPLWCLLFQTLTRIQCYHYITYYFLGFSVYILL